MRFDINLLRNKIKSTTSLKTFSEIEFLMNGTAAIDFAIQDAILKHPEIKDAYLPTFRCDCIDLPFKDNNIKIQDYEVCYNDEEKRIYLDIKDVDNCIVFLCDYFVHTNEYYEFIKSCKNKNVIIIYDVTQTLFCSNLNCEGSDYVVASLRKWFRTPDGGIVFSKDKLEPKLKGANNKFLFYKKLEKFVGSLKETKLTRKLEDVFDNKSFDQLLKNYRNRRLSIQTAKKIYETDFFEMIEKRRSSMKLLTEKLNQESLAGLSSNALFSYPYLTKNAGLDEKVDELRGNGFRCNRFWKKSNFEFENNISIDVCREFSSNDLERIKDILECDEKVILHFSDLHFSDDDFEENFERMYQEFEEKIKKENLKVDYIFLTGDMITFYSVRYGYQCLKVFLDRLKELLKLSNKEVFFVSGNHENLSIKHNTKQDKLFHNFIKENCNEKCVGSRFVHPIAGHSFVFYNSYIKKQEDSWTMIVENCEVVDENAICVIHGAPKHYKHNNIKYKNIICGHKLKEFKCEKDNNIKDGFSLIVSSHDGFCSGDYIIGVYKVKCSSDNITARPIIFSEKN